jgi:hypothetical protein
MEIESKEVALFRRLRYLSAHMRHEIELLNLSNFTDLVKSTWKTSFECILRYRTTESATILMHIVPLLKN